MAEQFVGVFLDDLVEMGGDYRAGVHHCIAEGLCLILQRLVNPDSL